LSSHEIVAGRSIGESHTWRNWGRTERATPKLIRRPRDAGEVATALAEAREAGLRVKAVGSGHSFSGIAVTDGMLLDLGAMSGLVSDDEVTRRVTVQAGTPLYLLNRLLLERELSLSNLGDIDRQTVAGAISTGTHGTGSRLGGLSTQVRALELVLSDGSPIRCDPTTEPELFAAARLGLGALGVVTTVELQCEAEFALRAEEVPMPLVEVLDNIQTLADTNDHFEFFWFPHTETALTKRNNRLPADEARRPLHPARAWLEDDFLANTVFGLTSRLARRRPSLTPKINRFAGRLLSERTYADTAYKVFVSPRRVRFAEAEYAVPREAVVEGLMSIRRIIERLGLLVSFPIEVRFAAGDDIPLSTAFGRDSAYLAVHMFGGQEYRTYFREVEAALVGLGARPHWGKIHTRTAEQLRPVFPRFDDFLATRERVDPGGLFGNAYLDRVLGPLRST
jgi:L-gulonolactone oxidase